MNIEMIQTILMLFILVMFVYALRLNDKRIKQIKSDFYNQGYIDGSQFVSKSISEHFKTKWEIDKSINKNEVL